MRHLVCLLSQQLLPNYQTVKHFEPDRVWRIASNGTRHLDDRFREALKRNFPHVLLPAIDAYIVDAHWMLPCYEAVEGLLDAYPADEWIINATGGTKMMAGGALAAALNAGAKRNVDGREMVRTVYIDLQQPGLIFDALTGKSEEMHVSMDAIEYLTLYGMESWAPDRYWEPDWASLARQWCAYGASLLPFVLTQDDLSKVRREGCERGNLVWLRQFPEAVRETIERLIAGQSRVNNWQMRFFTGDFLDVFMSDLLVSYKDALGLDSIYTGVKDRTREVGEVDLCASRGGELFVVECKSGVQSRAHADLQSHIGQLVGNLRGIGAKNARGLLVTSGRNALDGQGHLSEYARTLLNRNGIGILIDSQIKTLAKNFDNADVVLPILKDWLGGAPG